MPHVSDDILDWHEWPEPEPHRPPVTPHPVPLHESKPGLMDEEILPLEADLLKGP
ncbi:MAG: hypothetical protein LKI03_06100 [Acetobacter indonesiensis]|jgi:hypothetical protein|nr:hypothetical protein [Acetobacter indonesiensis]MCI1546157.1 hypothetical protein [Acetobacter indonesiensis]MCI1765603.1 hypothetical protein [Acetobacter indonesiensis]